jgi:hypothetical protein
MPRVSFFPPEAESPVEGSKTPILMTSPDAAAAPLPVLPAPPEVEEAPDEPPQAVRPSTIAPVNKATINFFMIFLLA